MFELTNLSNSHLEYRLASSILLMKCVHLKFCERFTNSMQNRFQFALNLSQDFFLLLCQRRYGNTLNGLDTAIPHKHISWWILSFNTLMLYAC